MNSAPHLGLTALREFSQPRAQPLAYPGVRITKPVVRGDPFITFAPRGGRGVKEVANFANDKTDRLRKTANKGGRGYKIPKILRT